MIKKIIKGLFGLFVIGFCFINFSSSAYSSITVKDNGELISGPGGVKFQVSGQGNLLSQNLGLSRRMLAFEVGTPKVYFFWYDGFPYMYYYFSNDNVYLQGFYNNYQVCGELHLGDDNVSNCVSYSINTGSFIESVKPFFNSIKSSDLFGYSYGYYVIYNRIYYLRVCFSSAEFGQSVCFMSSDGLHGSLNLTGDISFGDISSSIMSTSPGFINNYDPLPSGDLTNVSCPTVSQLIANYNQNGFYSGLCYSSDKIFNGSSFVSVQSQSIFDLFSSKDDFISSLNKFGTYCESSVYNNDVCVQAFSGEELRFNLISKIPKVDALGGRKSLYTYCGLYNYDPNATTCVASGVLPEYGSDYTVEDVVHSINNSQYSVFSPVTNNSEYNTVFNNGSGYEYSGDIISNIQLLFGKFTSLFKQQTSNTNGVLPGFIIIPFLIIVLFKLFRK